MQVRWVSLSLLTLVVLASCAPTRPPVEAIQEAKSATNDSGKNVRAEIDLAVHECVVGKDYTAELLKALLKDTFDPDGEGVQALRADILHEQLIHLADEEGRLLYEACIRTEARYDPEYRDELLQILKDIEGWTGK